MSRSLPLFLNYTFPTNVFIKSNFIPPTPSIVLQKIAKPSSIPIFHFKTKTRKHFTMKAKHKSKNMFHPLTDDKKVVKLSFEKFCEEKKAEGERKRKKCRPRACIVLFLMFAAPIGGESCEGEEIGKHGSERKTMGKKKDPHRSHKTQNS